MVFEGLRRDKAAAKAGIADHTLYQALRKPSVLAYLNSQQQVLRTSAAARSVARIDNLADEAESEHVKLNANTFLLGLEGIQPVQRTENIHHHKGLQPGITIIMAGPEPVPQIAQQAHETGKVIDGKVLPTPVPHPALRNALPAPAQTVMEPDKSAAVSRKAKRGTRGEK